MADEPVLDIEQAVRKRRAVRAFKPDPIPEDVLVKILEAGRLAPSSKNSQPWHFIVVRDKEKLIELSKMTYTGAFLPDAPLAIAVVLEDAKLESDAARAVQNMALVAWKYGIGTVWVTNYWEKGKEVLGVPMTGKYKLVTVMPFGYPAATGKKVGKKMRKALSEVVHDEQFGVPFVANE